MMRSFEFIRNKQIFARKHEEIKTQIPTSKKETKMTLKMTGAK